MMGTETNSEMFVETEQRISELKERGYEVIHDYFEKNSNCPIREVYLKKTSDNIFCILKQIIYIRTGDREAVKQIWLSFSDVRALASHI